MSEILTAKEYLEQLELIDIKIAQDLEMLSNIKTNATGIRGVDYSKDRVKSSPSGDELCNAVTRYIALDEEIEGEMEAFAKARAKIINEIRNLNDPTYIRILFKIYVQYKDVKQAAREMNKSYAYVRTNHLRALSEFERLNPERTYLT